MPESTSNTNLDLTSTVALVTGGSNGIGAAVVTQLNSAGATVIIVDLESTKSSANTLISSLPSPHNAVFMPANIADWVELRSVFSAARTRFGRLDFVIANAGTMEHQPVLEDSFDEQGELEEPRDAYRVIDVNLKGSLNTLKLALHHLKSSPPLPPTSPRISRSITLLASTAGYFDGAGTTAYTSSKHGVIGLLRSSQSEAAKHNIRVNAIAPFFTTTHLTSGISEKWVAAGLEVNSPAAVATIIVDVATDEKRSGEGVLVAGRFVRELENSRMGVLGQWVGEDVKEFMGRAGAFFEKIGGYVLPGPR
ncbi:dehydrogenase with different specificitie [Aspergillus pseudodeflectus]|uniref:Dehydrogenase with different specificitie n=1 Tax=Aspergillus pseudodeflectus TaxID=176178 RepID=A0ABR4K9S3_9EURO